MDEALKRIELTEEAFRSCREKPQYKFLVSISEAKHGEEFEIVGEDRILSFETVLEILDDEGFEYDILDRDDILGTYTLIARKNR
ncbi:MAG: hypothetical protein F7B20_07780 [Aeropyrum sp.]|nr:hypothetical protein [Aeropyrum sp.]MCE4616637.1 hypothetical protein [Aeropyrum sp.]